MSVHVADSISNLAQVGDPVPVALSNELVRLLSEQLYQSPLKAIEELVVNSYDADASQCRVFVPLPDQSVDYILIYDDGLGMSKEGLGDLWQIGRSNKSADRAAESKKKRKQIGKFGIGKLATFTIARNLTYITKNEGRILSATVDFDQFSQSPTGAGTEILLPVRLIDDWTSFVSKTDLAAQLASAGIDAKHLHTSSHWTIALLEGLKTKGRSMKSGHLRWVLSTAMPLKADFQLFLNKDKVLSSKESLSCPIKFDITTLPDARLKALNETTREEWKVTNGKLTCQSFPSGITGSVVVAEQTFGGKSDDLARSHGFFIKVRERLVNEEDALFGMKPLVYGTFSRFRADVQADDLDQGIKATRESVEESQLKRDFQSLLRELFNEANSRWDKWKTDGDNKNNPKKEGERTTVSPHLVEFPTADALLIQSASNKGAEANEEWFYINEVLETEVDALVQSLYREPRNKYNYEYRENGIAQRLVKFDLPTSTFWINGDHELIKEYWFEGTSRSLIQDIVTAEAMLEIYLRESAVPPHIIGEVLSKRDFLLRGLARDHSYSLDAISASLKDSASDEHELEIQLVVAARALGFNATQISGAGEPDGIARFTNYPQAEKTIILEAKSSKKNTSLSAIDFAGLRQHMVDNQADGCLLVAPNYPGSTQEEDAQAARRAKEQKISCWTVNQLARFVSQAEKRQLHAQHVLDVVLNAFSPNEVTDAIDKILAEPSWTNAELYKVVLHALRRLEKKVTDRPRSADLVALAVSDTPEFSDVSGQEVEKVLRELANASQGGMIFRDNSVQIFVSYDELDRRLQNLTKQSVESRRKSEFRAE